MSFTVNRPSEIDKLKSIAALGRVVDIKELMGNRFMTRGLWKLELSMDLGCVSGYYKMACHFFLKP